VHLPEGLGPEEIKQLVAEQLVTVNDKRGFPRQEWHKLRDRNEQLDMAVYARAALTMLGADRYGERFWQRGRRGQVGTADLPRPMPVETGQGPQPGAPAGTIIRQPGTSPTARGSLGSRLA
jgi:phage terminase large subunit GpA-like protein